MKYKDYYDLMGVSRDASQEEIKRAYRKLARKYHPDVSSEKNAEARFKEINEAYEVLKDPQKRQAYDQLGTNWESGQEFRPPPGWADGFDFKTDLGGFGSGGFSDFFESLFGMDGQTHQWRAGQSGFRTRGHDQTSRVNIALEDAYNGSTRTLSLEMPGGKPRTLRVNIPKGVTEGQRIRLAGQSTRAVGRGSSGDLYLEIAFQPHPFFRVEGRDIYLDLPVTPWEVALGAKVTVPTLGGRVDLSIPPGSQSGQRLRLKGRGLPGSPPGNQHIVLQVVTPRADTQAKKELFEQMRREMAFNPRAGLGV